jgi:hypothetical protein
VSGLNVQKHTQYCVCVCVVSLKAALLLLFTALRKRIVKSGRCQPQKTILSLFPILVWLPKYNWKENIVGDVVSGFTVAIMHIPQGKNTSI